LFLRIVMCLEMVQHIWEDHGEHMPEFFSTMQICPTLYYLLVGIHGISLVMSKFPLFHLNYLVIYGFGFWSISIYYYRDHIQFSEYKKYGPGSNTNNRVKWMKKLDLRTVTRMASIGFIDDEGWVKNQLF
jgi:hypothetical protein